MQTIRLAEAGSLDRPWRMQLPSLEPNHSSAPWLELGASPASMRREYLDLFRVSLKPPPKVFMTLSRNLLDQILSSFKFVDILLHP